jgi:hypothetical protein
MIIQYENQNKCLALGVKLWALSIKPFPFFLFTFYLTKYQFFYIFLNESVLSLEKSFELRLY